MQMKQASVARELYQEIIAIDLKQAEEIIEDARKIAWVSQFSGAPLAAVEDCYARSPKASALAVRLAGHSLQEVEAILHELRFAIYVNAYGVQEHSRFGAMMRGALSPKQ